jgi:DNA-binding CsgD family transcriptional regulator
VIASRIEERQRLEKSWRALCGHIDSGLNAGSVVSLGAQDVDLMTRILESGTRNLIARDLGIRRDSVDKRLGSIRECLGLENHHQLLSALAELKMPRAQVPVHDSMVNPPSMLETVNRA